jgi:hypothetical protein
MRAFAIALALWALPAAASAQEAELPDVGPPEPEAFGPADAPEGGALEAEGYVALSADPRAQASLGGFRAYLERTRELDEALYAALDPRLAELERRETAADWVFGVATGLSVGALVAAIPVHETLGLDPAIGFLVGGGATFVLGLIVQAVLRPGHADLMRLIDLHDERLGRR